MGIKHPKYVNFKLLRYNEFSSTLNEWIELIKSEAILNGAIEQGIGNGEWIEVIRNDIRSKL